ncbi:MAG: hypothetical protein E6212_08095 [Actinomyces sp.]|nr:hypothetical protein [Actinomyces sp.]
MNEDSIKSFLSLLESLPPTPSVTFRGYVDTSITEPRAIASPVLTATSHNISIATNNLAVPQVAIFIGQNGRGCALLAPSASTCPKAHQNVSSFPWGNDVIIDVLTQRLTIRNVTPEDRPTSRQGRQPEDTQLITAHACQQGR